MGEEIWRQTEGRVDAFVQSVGTAASVRGVAGSLRDKRSDIYIVAASSTRLSRPTPPRAARCPFACVAANARG
jgi:cysteine synthase